MPKGQPIPIPRKYSDDGRRARVAAAGGATNWQSPSFNPETGFFYVGTSRLVQHVLLDRYG